MITEILFGYDRDDMLVELVDDAGGTLTETYFDQNLYDETSQPIEERVVYHPGMAGGMRG